MIKLEHTVAYNAKEAGDKLGMSAYTIRKYIRNGLIKAKKIGRAYYITDKALEEYISADTKDEVSR